MENKLDREVTSVEDWRHLACKLEIPLDVRREFGESGARRKSPTKEVLQSVAHQFPNTTLIDVVRALEEIQRNDAIQIITQQFRDTVGECKKLSCLFSVYLD